MWEEEEGRSALGWVDGVQIGVLGGRSARNASHDACSMGLSREKHAKRIDPHSALKNGLCTSPYSNGLCNQGSIHYWHSSILHAQSYDMRSVVFVM